MQQNPFAAVQARTPSVLETNKVLKNTYLLLSMTLMFSGLCAFASIALRVPFGGALVANIIAIGMLWFALPKTANSSKGIPVIFAITGLLGFGLGPLLSMYLAVNPGIVMVALGGTGTIFLGLSGYALTTKKDFSFLAGFTMVGILVAFVMMLANIFLQMPALSLGISALIIMAMSTLILWRTADVVRGGETNYIMVTADLFIAILNIFTSLLQILGVMGGDD